MNRDDSDATGPLPGRFTAMVTVDFGRRALEIEPGEALAHLQRWHAAVSAHPSTRA